VSIARQDHLSPPAAGAPPTTGCRVVPHVPDTVQLVAEILLFHHALGLTPGCVAFADRLRAAGHVVHSPDLYDGQTFDELADGVAHAETLGFGAILERGRLAADRLPSELVYAGFSLGVLPAQMLAQTRPGARGALLLHGCVPTEEFGRPWPPGVPVQIHTMEADGWGDVDVARHLAATLETLQLFLYPGDRHLFADDSVRDYDDAAAALLTRRVLAFLDGLDEASPGRR
jgi:dienelactone hydrolase